MPMPIRSYYDQPLMHEGCLFTHAESMETFICLQSIRKTVYAMKVNPSAPERMETFDGTQVMLKGYIHENFRPVFDPDLSMGGWCSMTNIITSTAVEKFKTAHDDIWYAMFPQGRLWQGWGKSVYSIVRSEPRKSITLRRKRFSLLAALLGKNTITVTPEVMLHNFTIRPYF